MGDIHALVVVIEMVMTLMVDLIMLSIDRVNPESTSLVEPRTLVELAVDQVLFIKIKFKQSWFTCNSILTTFE